LRHLERFGVFESATLPDHQMTSAVDLSRFDVIVLTGFAADIPEQGLTHILESKKPVLVLEGRDFSLAQRLGLTQGVEATREECDRLISVAPGIDRYSRFAGRELVFTRPANTIASVANLSPGVLPLYSPANNPDRWTVFVELERNIAVMGLSDTTRLSKSVWRLFDLLLDQIHPIGPRWEGYRQVAETYLETGLSEYLDSAAQDRRQETDRYRPGEVVSETWVAMVNWNLFELADHLSNRIEGMFPDSSLLSRFPAITIPHPTCGGRDDRWFMGQDCTASPHVPFWGEYIQGTDLGISARHNGKTFFYMGDTVPLLTDDKIGECDGGAICNDAIIGLAPWDTDPADGVDALPYVWPYQYFEQLPGGNIGIHLGWTYRHQSIPGIHTNVWDPKFWNKKVGGITFDPVFTVPAAAISIDLPYRSVPLPTMVLFYDTANAPDEIKHADPKVTPRSWAACSLDGLKFSNCYGSGVPFSEDRKGFPARFLQPVPVPITADELTAMCGQAGRRGYAPGNPLCAPGLYDPASPVGGLLFFAPGRYWSGSLRRLCEGG